MGFLAFSLGILNSLRLRFYSYLISYFTLKNDLFDRAEKFEKALSDDILDPEIIPSQVEEISILIEKLTSLSSYLDSAL